MIERKDYGTSPLEETRYQRDLLKEQRDRYQTALIKILHRAGASSDFRQDLLACWKIAITALNGQGAR